MGVRSKADCETPNGVVNGSHDMTLDGKVDDTNVCDESGVCNDDIQVTRGIELNVVSFLYCQLFMTNCSNSGIFINCCNSLLQMEAAKVGSLRIGDARTRAQHPHPSLLKTSSVLINLLGTQTVMQNLMISKSQAQTICLLAMVNMQSETS